MVLKDAPRRILLVEDSEITIKVVTRLLAPHFEVRAARNWIEASEAMLSDLQKPHLLLVDVNLDTMNGDRIVSVWKKTQHESVRMVLFSDMDVATLAAKAAACGADGYLPKSILGEDGGKKFVAAISKYLK